MKNMRAKGRLKKECEKAKIDLSDSLETTICVDCIADGIDLNYNINRADLEEICKGLFNKCIPPIDQALKDADLKVDDIDEVVLVGGSSRIPKIQKMIEDYFGNKNINDIKQKISKKINPDEVVALGASIQAAFIKGEKFRDIIKITDINPLSLGFGVKRRKEMEDGLMSIVIPKNCILPHKHTKTYITIFDYQKEINIRIYQGENKYVKDNYYIGGFKLKGLRKALAGEVKINQTMELDENGILKITAEEQGSDNLKEIMIEDVLNLTNEQIENFKQKEYQLQYNNQFNLEVIKLKDNLKQFIYKQKEIINQSPINKQKIIIQQIDELEILLKNNNITIDEIKEAYNNLNNLIK